MESHLRRRGEYGSAKNTADSGDPAGIEDAGKEITAKFSPRRVQERKNNRPQGEEPGIKYLRQLLGKINYVLQVNPQDSEFRQAGRMIQEMLEEMHISI